MVRKVALIGLVVAAAVAFFGCHKAENASLKSVNDALVTAGFKLDSFHPANGARFSAQTCASGTLDGVDAIVCEVAVDKQPFAKKAGEEWLGQAPTGVVLTRGSTMLALADRGHVDPNGRTIHKITQAYSKLR
jgi:hypothetical protein